MDACLGKGLLLRAAIAGLRVGDFASGEGWRLALVSIVIGVD